MSCESYECDPTGTGTKCAGRLLPISEPVLIDEQVGYRMWEKAYKGNHSYWKCSICGREVG